MVVWVYVQGLSSSSLPPTSVQPNPLISWRNIQVVCDSRLSTFLACKWCPKNYAYEIILFVVLQLRLWDEVELGRKKTSQVVHETSHLNPQQNGTRKIPPWIKEYFHYKFMLLDVTGVCVGKGRPWLPLSKHGTHTPWYFFCLRKWKQEMSIYIHIALSRTEAYVQFPIIMTVTYNFFMPFIQF